LRNLSGKKVTANHSGSQRAQREVGAKTAAVSQKSFAIVGWEIARERASAVLF